MPHPYNRKGILSNDAQRDKGGGFGDAVDGDIDPGRLLVEARLGFRLCQIRPMKAVMNGDGLQVRDWLYVEDHARALWSVLRNGVPGETYNIGGHNEQRNLDVVREICRILDSAAAERMPRDGFASLISFVKDRPGHDRRYAIDASKIRRDLGWQPAESFTGGIRKTVSWYLDHAEWTRSVTSGDYQKWMSANYQERGAA